jgi:hypothetical protein
MRREPTEGERALLARLAARWHGRSPRWVDEILVSSMNDGGMGSLRLWPMRDAGIERTFGRCVAEYLYTDTDGVDVLVSLNVDDAGEPFELDIWRTDFTAQREPRLESWPPSPPAP